MIPRAADGAIAINTKAKALFDKGKIRARIREIETVHHGVITGYIRELQAAHREARRLLGNHLIATCIRKLQAAHRVGFSEKTAQQQGSRLLSNVMVAAVIEKAIGERASRVPAC